MRYRIPKPLDRYAPKPSCPWCGSTRWPGHYRLVNGRPRARSFRVAKNKVNVEHSVKGLRRYGIAANGRPYMRGAASRTWAVCSHPFHDQFNADPEPPRVIPPRVHNPDLAEWKQSIKRALQGKDRR